MNLIRVDSIAEFYIPDGYTIDQILYDKWDSTRFYIDSLTVKSSASVYEQLCFVSKTIRHLYPCSGLEWDLDRLFLISGLDKHEMFDLDLRLLNFQFSNKIPVEEHVVLQHKEKPCT